MKIILATGIYPPAIGGPATYCRALAEELVRLGHEVKVITYGQVVSDKSQVKSPKGKLETSKQIYFVSSRIPILRWWRYSRVFRKIGKDSDVVIAFSSVSVGVPLWLAHLKKPKKILRLGGDFFWERYTAIGGMKSLRKWYASRPWSQFVMQWILNTFDNIVFSTRFQEELYEEYYKKLTPHFVLENALPAEGHIIKHQKHDPFRLLFMGRMVGFKNLPMLLDAAEQMNGITLTLVGDGPVRSLLIKKYDSLIKKGIVRFIPSVHGDEKRNFFEEHDLLVLPSITEISPNVALEARVSGLPVLLSKETGLSDFLTDGIIIRDCSSEECIYHAINDVMQKYDDYANSAAQKAPERVWSNVAKEWLRILYT